MASSDGGFESSICLLAQNDAYEDKPFYYGGEEYFPVIAGKPGQLDNHGSPKTDVFIRGERTDGSGYYQDFRISVKKSTYDMVESHMRKNRYESVFGSGWEQVIAGFADEKIDFFNTQALAVRNKFRLGWEGKVVASGANERSSVVLPKMYNEALVSGDWYHSDCDVKNFDGRKIPIENAGFADFMFVGDEDNYIPSDIGELLQLSVPASDYAESHDLYYCFAAVNSAFKDDLRGLDPVNNSAFTVVPVEWDFYEDDFGTPVLMYGEVQSPQDARRGDETLHQLMDILAYMEITAACDIITQGASANVRVEPLSEWQRQSIKMGEDVDIATLLYGSGIELSYEGFYDGLDDGYDELENDDYLAQVSFLQDMADGYAADNWY